MNLIAKTSRIGLGAFLLVPVKKGDVVIDWSDHPLFEEPPRLLPEYRFIQISAGVYSGPVGPEKYPDAYINHSCLPNTEVLFDRPRIHLIALRDIALGEEVTLDYSTLHEPPWSMKCDCGTAICRGTILGKPSRGIPKGRKPPG
jgi:hypothetical protein